jgi:hypothetical protein
MVYSKVRERKSRDHFGKPAMRITTETPRSPKDDGENQRTNCAIH